MSDSGGIDDVENEVGGDHRNKPPVLRSSGKNIFYPPSQVDPGQGPSLTYSPFLISLDNSFLPPSNFMLT